jgi:tetratricopeptide (TPR) repeat protein
MSTLPGDKAMILTPDQRVRVFVSSTLVELGDERRAVRRVVQDDLGLHPVMFEAGARPHPSRDLYRAYLEQSHVYLGIFWESYGWVAPDMEVSGIEDEYNLSSGKKRLIYVKRSENGRAPELECLLQHIRDEGTVTYVLFSTAEELAERVRDDLAHLLSESFLLDIARSGAADAREPAPAYLDALRSEMEARALIGRDVPAAEVQQRLDGAGKLLLEGEPGVGKTFLLGELGRDPSTIYVPLRNKTTQQVCSYLATHLAARRGVAARPVPSEAEALAALQQELANGRVTLLVDEAEQNLATTRALLSLELFGCRAVFAARYPDPETFGDMLRYRVPPFDRDEVSRFLEASGVILEPGELQRLRAASEGNPLYLYYFTRNPVSPLPEGLQGYQRILWGRLSPQQQEVANLVAHSVVPLELSDLHSLLERQGLSGSVMEARQLVASAFPLVRRTGDGYELFHAYFEEFVRASASSDGLSVHYHSLLGEHAVDEGAAMAAAHHLLLAQDTRARQYLLDGARVAMLHGAWALSEELLSAAVEGFEREEDRYEEAVARHLLAELYRESGRYSDARRELDVAAQMFDELGEQEWKRQTDLMASLMLVQEGRVQETVERLAAALHGIQDDDEERAIISLNLSYAYVQANRYREGATAAERSLNLFEQLGNEIGVYGSLTNLASCAGELGDHALQGRYADRIIEAARIRNLPRVEAAGLNHRAAAQRAEGDAAGAQRALEDCVALHQRLGNVEGEALNIANLGNAFLDQGMYPEAESAYAESLAKAREHDLPRQEGHALELLARLKQREAMREGDPDLHRKVVDLGNEALVIQKRLGERLRIANTQGHLANSYEELDMLCEAADGREDAGNHREAIQMWEEAADQYERAIVLWNVLGERGRAVRCVEHWVRCRILSEEPDLGNNSLAEALEGVSRSPDDARSGSYYVRALRTVMLRARSASLNHLMRGLAVYCKKHHDADEKKCLELALEAVVAEMAQSSSPRLLRAAAAGIEQADQDVLPVSSLDALCQQLANSLDHLHYRCTPDDYRTWTIGLGWRRPLVIQVVCMSEDHSSLGVGAALALLLRSDGEALEDAVVARGGSQEVGFALHLMSRGDAIQKAGMERSSFGEDSLPVTATESNVPWEEQQPPTYLILRDDYARVSDFTRAPYNKAFGWVVSHAVVALVAHCVHRRRDETSDLGGEAARFSNLALG